MVLSPSRLMRYLLAADGITAHAAVSPEKGILWSKHPVADVVRLQNPDSQSRPKSHDSGSTEEARAAKASPPRDTAFMHSSTPYVAPRPVSYRPEAKGLPRWNV